MSERAQLSFSCASHSISLPPGLNVEDVRGADAHVVLAVRLPAAVQGSGHGVIFRVWPCAMNAGAGVRYVGPGDGGAVQWMKVLWPFGVALRGGGFKPPHAASVECRTSSSSARAPPPAARRRWAYST